MDKPKINIPRSQLKILLASASDISGMRRIAASGASQILQISTIRIAMATVETHLKIVTSSKLLSPRTILASEMETIPKMTTPTDRPR